MSHNIREHEDLGELIEKVICHEDYDQYAIVTHDGDGFFLVSKYWKQDFEHHVSLIEAFYLAYGPDCYCDENEN